MTHTVPYAPKSAVTIIVVGDSFEATALRAVLENFNYRVTVHWVGSRKEFLMLLSGDIEIADDFIILSCHGIEQGIDVPGEDPVSPQEIGEIARLHDKTILNLGCKTGSEEFRAAFMKAGATHYIAPTDYPESSAAMIFAANLFYSLKSGQKLSAAVAKAASVDEETSHFQLS